ncbi:MAG: carbohydrate ABC transporter permease [Candidatus Kapaibacterium sp.]
MKWLIYAILLITAAGMVFPMIWMLLLSVKSYPESYTNIIELIGSAFTLSNYSDALQSDAFGIYFINSLLVAAAVTAGNVLFCLLTGYALARKDFTGKKIFYATILGVLIIPPHVIMIPLYRLMVEFGWINTYYALIIPWLVTPFGIFLVRQYIIRLPGDIEDAARIDGAGEWYIIFRIVMPLAKPVLTVLAIYTFLNNWNSFLFPFLFTNDETFRTLPVGLAFYLGKQSIDWGHLMAGAGISAIPVLLIFIIFQRQVIRGLTAGAIKE